MGVGDELGIGRDQGIAHRAQLGEPLVEAHRAQLLLRGRLLAPDLRRLAGVDARRRPARRVAIEARAHQLRRLRGAREPRALERPPHRLAPAGIPDPDEPAIEIGARGRGGAAREQRGGDAGGDQRGAEGGPPPAPPAPRRQRAQQQLERGKSIRGRLAQRPAERRAEAAGHPDPQRARARGDRRADRSMIGARERSLSVERLEQRDREAELIGAGIDGATIDLLGRHVRGRARGAAAAGRAAAGDLAGGRGLVIRHREAEVRDPRAFVLAHQHVRRLDVAVHEPRGVRGREATTRGDEHRDDLERGAGAGVQPVVERAADHQLHRDEPLPVLLTEVVDGDHVRMREPRDRAPFLHELAARARAGRAVQQLDGDLPVELRIVRGVHHAHPPGPERSLNPVPPEPVALGERRGRARPGQGRGMGEGRRVLGRARIVRVRVGRVVPALGARGRQAHQHATRGAVREVGVDRAVGPRLPARVREHRRLVEARARRFPCIHAAILRFGRARGNGGSTDRGDRA